MSDDNSGRVIQASGDTFTISELAYEAGTSEPAMRRMLNAAGAAPRLDEHSKDRTERIPRQLVIDLVALRDGDRLGRKLRALLGKTT
jgi:hypothetical protein